jgi:hypothetical protein
MVRREAAHRIGNPIWYGVLTVVLLCVIFLFLTPFPDAEEVNVIKRITTVAAPSPGVEMNVIKSIKTTSSGIEIELYNSRPFPGHALPYVLRIGSKEFFRSRYPTVSNREQAQEQQHTLIFFLPVKDFAGLTTGDSVTVFYGQTGWDFGTLDKNIVDQ